MTIWILEDGNIVDVVMEPHLGDTYTICAHDKSVLEPLMKVASEPAFETIPGSTPFKWAVHMPIYRVMPEGWKFITSSNAHKTERLEEPVSAYPREWSWEAVQLVNCEGDEMEEPIGHGGFEDLKDPALVIAELHEIGLEEASLIPVYRDRSTTPATWRLSKEWDDEYEDDDFDEGEE